MFHLVLATLVLLSSSRLPPAPSSPEVAARYRDSTITFEELDHLILGRFALSKVGRETRLFMLKRRLIETIAREQGVTAGDEAVTALMKEVEKGVVAAGQARDLGEYLRDQGVSLEEFRENLRLAVLHQLLTKRSLGIPEDQPVSGEQQEMWIESEISRRQLEEIPAPWEDGVVLSCGGVELGREEFLRFLRHRIDPEELRTGLINLLRVERMRARMPDLTDKALHAAVEEEIRGRQNEVAADPRYKGISYEQLLASQGILMDFWPDDPEILKSALARLWIERSYDEGALRAKYEDERELFDGKYGEAVETWVLFIRATDRPNELIPRDFEAAEKELYELSRKITSKNDFQAQLSRHSEDRASREKQGYLGWVTRQAQEGPNQARDAIFRALDAGTYQPLAPENATSRLIGPIRTKSGVVLLWLGQRRPVPAWTSMVVYVQRELRRRFAVGALEVGEVWTFLDRE